MKYKSKVVLTGGEGMIGSMLRTRLINLDYDVVTIDDRSRDPRRLSPFRDSTRSYNIDILDPGKFDVLVSVMRGAAAVVNLAADVGGVHYNQANNQAIFARNAALQSIPAAAALDAGVSSFIQISSVCVYTPKDEPHREGDALGLLPRNNWGYSLAKRAGEDLARSSGFERCCIVRPTNAFGLRDYFDDRAHVIPALIRRACEPGPTLVVKSPPGVVRSFAPASLVAEAIACVLERGNDGGIYNVPGYPIRIDDLAEAIIEGAGAARVALQGKEAVYQYQHEETGENVRLVDGRKLHELLGSPPPPTRSEFEDTLEAVIGDFVTGQTAAGYQTSALGSIMVTGTVAMQPLYPIELGA